MSPSRKRSVLALGLGVIASGLVAAPALANAAGTGLVINEVYGGGGSTSTAASYKSDFVELYNPTGAALSTSGLSLQYRTSAYASTGTVSVLALPAQTVASHDYFLVQVSNPNGCSGSPCGGADVPSPDFSGTSLNMAGGSGQALLAQGTTAITATGAAMQSANNVVDFVGYGTATSSETSPTGTALSTTTSAQRSTTADHDNNSTDFAAPATPSPQHASAGTPAALKATAPGNKTGTVGTAVQSFDLAASGGTPPYSWTATGMPPGISVSTSGTVSGTPTTAGSYTPNVTVTDSASPTPATDTATFSFTIAQGADKTIAEIQGTGAASPLVGQTVHTTGIVTAKYPSGGLNGIYIQTAGTGGATDATPGASDAIFVFGANSGASTVSIGDYVDVTGPVSEFAGTTEITPASGGVKPATGTGAPVTPLVAAYPTTEADREAHEGELLAPTNRFTVTNTYSTNQYAEIGLATGDKPLLVPTEVADAQDTSAIQAVKDDNLARKVTLDDGASINFLSGANKDIPLPWLSVTNPIRVGAQATLRAPVILEYRNNTWKFQPTQQVTGEGASVATFANTRTDAPEAVGGNLRLATFNVLNYFNTVGVDYAAAGHSCTYYDDRAGNHDTVNTCGATGPRGAAEADDLARQQTKIVTAINKLGADIVSLEEVENSVALGESNRDDALSTLVNALNTAAGSNRWAYAPSPAAADLPATSEQDVIRTAFIYDPNTVSLVGASKVLVGSAAFGNAREPLAQAFKPKGTADSKDFAVVVNHFKSKGSGTDDGTGQGNANPDRVNQAHDLLPFANDFAASRGTDKVFLTGDFNSYSKEDPIQVLEGGGYTTINSDNTNEWTYSFGGESGSLDHVLANGPARAMISGADVWGINSGESVAFEYSRYNYNATDFYQPNQFRASDHDPEIVGLNVDTTPADVHLNLLAVNDFHGRINSNTVKWAGTVEQLTKAASDAGADQTLLVGAGDLIGASEFASAVDKDQPTIDMFNALGLDASAVGNHEFDQGWADLRDRVIGAPGSRNAQWDYLGANVYAKGTRHPVLPEYAAYDVNGVQVAVVGAVTQETRSLVSPGGIADLDFGDPVDAVNRVAGELSDGNPANGEADVIMASFHAGATQGTGSNYAAEVAKGGEFGEMANLDPAVDVIFNGHTHQAYAWDAPVPGQPGRTRPIIQTGEYGTNVGQIQLTINPTTKEVTAYSAKNVARTMVADSELVAAFPRVAWVKQIVDAALAHAAEVGNQPVGHVTSNITTAFSGGSFVDGKYAGGTRDNRAAESALGDLVGNALRDGIPAVLGKPDLGIVNPGGLRSDLMFAGDTSNNPANTDGVVTYAEANSVLPFVNNIWLVDLTGAQLKNVLEQQWQPSGASRPYLALGLSDNVRVTEDAAKPAGSRITSVTIDGSPIDPAKHYSVSTFSFLGTGGDNFTAFKDGAHQDTGLVDRDVWIGYLKDAGAISPDFARQQVFESGKPASVTPGQHVEFTAGPDLTSPTVPNTGETLDLTSLGSPANTAVQATWVAPGGGTTDLGSDPVSSGTSSVTFDVPAGTGGGEIRLVAQPSGTTVTIPVAHVDPPPPAPSTVSATAGPMTYGTDGSVAVTVTPATATGTVKVLDGSTVLGEGTLSGGGATVAIKGNALEPGSHDLTVRYLGDAQTSPSSGSVTVQVSKAGSQTAGSATPSSVVVGTGSSSIQVSVSASGVKPTGTVDAYIDGTKVASGTLADGRATFQVGPFHTVGTKTVELRYGGDSHVDASQGSTTVEVTKASSTTAAHAHPDSVRVKKGTADVAVTVSADGITPSGTVEALVDGQVVDTATLSGGSATLHVGPFDSVGQQNITVRYSGDTNVSGSQGTTSVQVTKQKSRLTVTHTPDRAKAGRSRVTLDISVTADGRPAAGWVRIEIPGRDDLVVKLEDGAATVKLPRFDRPGTKRLELSYNGSDTVEKDTATEVVEVVGT